MMLITLIIFPMQHKISTIAFTVNDNDDNVATETVVEDIVVSAKEIVVEDKGVSLVAGIVVVVAVVVAVVVVVVVVVVVIVVVVIVVVVVVVEVEKAVVVV